jgi:hypothetical protein
MNELDKERFFQHVDGHKSQYIQQLAEAVAYVLLMVVVSALERTGWMTVALL